MKNLKHIALFLSCLVIASCTKDIDESEPSNECSILDIQLTGQLGKATIERVDDNQGTVTLYIFEQADYPWKRSGSRRWPFRPMPRRMSPTAVRSISGIPNARRVLSCVPKPENRCFGRSTSNPRSVLCRHVGCQRHQDIPGPEYQRQRYRKVGYFDGRFRVRVVRLAGVG